MCKREGEGVWYAMYDPNILFTFTMQLKQKHETFQFCNFEDIFKTHHLITSKKKKIQKQDRRENKREGKEGRKIHEQIVGCIT